MVVGAAWDDSLVLQLQAQGPSRTCFKRNTEEEKDGEREFFIDNLLVRIHFIIVMIRWTGLAPWELEFPFPGSLTFTFLVKIGP